MGERLTFVQRGISRSSISYKRSILDCGEENGAKSSARIAHNIEFPYDYMLTS